METSRSSKWRGVARRICLSAGALIVASLLCVLLCWRIWLGRKSDGVSAAVRPAVEAVLNAKLWSRVSGGYWENEMMRQSKSVANLSLPDRVAFYRAIVLNCDLDASRALLFVEVVGDDAESLRQHLTAFKTSADFKNLPLAQRRNVEDWIGEMRIVAEQRSAVVSRTNGE